MSHKIREKQSNFLLIFMLTKMDKNKCMMMFFFLSFSLYRVLFDANTRRYWFCTFYVQNLAFPNVVAKIFELSMIQFIMKFSYNFENRFISYNNENKFDKKSSFYPQTTLNININIVPSTFFFFILKNDLPIFRFHKQWI